MKKFKKIQTKMALSFAIIVVLTMIISTVGVLTASKLSNEALNNQTYIIQPLDYMIRFAIPYGQARASMRDIGRSETEEDNKKHKEALETNLNLINQYMNSYLILLENYADRDEEEYIAVKAICDILVVYTDICVNKLIPAGMQNDSAAVFAIISEDLGSPGKVIRENIDLLTTINTTQGQDGAEQASASLFTSILTNVILTVVVIALVIFLAVYVSGTIEKQLKNVLGKIKNATQNIESAVTGLSDVSKNLADGSSTQAASIQETSATMNETTSMIAQTAENTSLATKFSQESKQSADNGKSKMQEMVQTMKQLKESSNTISNIIKTIDDIAFQTNLLAINATVEAARAGGDAGRSFAVVANEVRNLSNQSAEAAANTTQIIEKNIFLTNNGEKISAAVAESLATVTEKFDNLDKIISEIHAASEEQASGMNQINTAVRQIELLTQQNAAMAEETTSSAQNLQNQTSVLEQSIEEAYELINKRNS